MPAQPGILRQTLVCIGLAFCIAAPAAAQSASSTPADRTGPAADSPTRDPMAVELDAYPDVRAAVVRGDFAEALALLQQNVAGNENDPNYFNLLGTLAIKVRDFPTAASALERVVIMQPENAGAWLDLAIAETEIGNHVSAQGYLDHIEDQFEPPAPLRAVIGRYRDRIARQSQAPAAWQFQVQTSAGTDTNANSGLQSNLISLTPLTGREDFELLPGFTARRDNFLQYGASAAYSRQFGSDRVDIAMGVRKRQFFKEHDFSTLDVTLGAGVQRPTPIGDASIAVQAEHLTLGGKSLLRNYHAIAQIEHPYAGCRVGVSADLEWRRYLSLSSLDGNVVWGQLGVSCDWSIADLKTTATLIGRIGNDKPNGNRVGGRTMRHEIIALVGLPLGGGATAEMSLALASAQDAEGYSPLLENNAARRLERRNARVAVTFPVANLAELLFVAEDNRFTSNLALFQQSGRSISVGLRRRF